MPHPSQGAAPVAEMHYAPKRKTTHGRHQTPPRPAPAAKLADTGNERPRKGKRRQRQRRKGNATQPHPTHTTLF
eukprot:6326062-Lingulodinium_polyedra.AAC.1